MIVVLCMWKESTHVSEFLQWQSKFCNWISYGTFSMPVEKCAILSDHYTVPVLSVTRCWILWKKLSVPLKIMHHKLSVKFQPFPRLKPRETPSNFLPWRAYIHMFTQSLPSKNQLIIQIIFVYFHIGYIQLQVRVVSSQMRSYHVRKCMSGIKGIMIGEIWSRRRRLIQYGQRRHLDLWTTTLPCIISFHAKQ